MLQFSEVLFADFWLTPNEIKIYEDRIEAGPSWFSFSFPPISPFRLLVYSVVFRNKPEEGECTFVFNIAPLFLFPVIPSLFVAYFSWLLGIKVYFLMLFSFGVLLFFELANIKGKVRKKLNHISELN